MMLQHDLGSKLGLLFAQAKMKPDDSGYQRMRWDALRKSINGIVNKVRACEQMMMFCVWPGAHRLYPLQPFLP